MMNTYIPPKAELEQRISRFYQALQQLFPQWDTVLIVNKTNMYYFTGTRQDGVFVLKRDGTIGLFVRRSFNRATEESPLSCIFPMRSYAQVAAAIGEDCGNTLIEKETVPVILLERIRKYLKTEQLLPAEPAISLVRAVKSPWELNIMQICGEIHEHVMSQVIPSLLREGMTESEFFGLLYSQMMNLGYHGISRFAAFQAEIQGAQFGFGDNSLYPTSFDGPGGMRGLYPAAPSTGSSTRTLKPGDLVTVDLGFGIGGYHTDKTQVYCFHGVPSKEAHDAHCRCMQICQNGAALLKPGAIPEDIYNAVTPLHDLTFMENYMGLGSHAVQFLGHSVGLTIDEVPIIAKGFQQPLVENMVFALEPKKGIPNQGTVGVEETFLVTPGGGQCISGGMKEILIV